MMFDLNKNYEERDTILFGGYDETQYTGGIRRFENLDAVHLKKLIELKFIDNNDRQNMAPSTEKIMKFISRYKGYTVHGYAVSPERDDYRISIEGVYKNKPAESYAERHEFNTLFADADELETNEKMYCWFD